MNKYTIIKAFEKGFPYPIWKIEVDCDNSCIAIEYRDPTTTFPYFAVFDFKGNDKGTPVHILEKEWTIEAIQGEFLILKRYGSASPIEAGIKIIHYPTKQVVFTGMEYVLKEVYQGFLLATHRSVPTGLYYHIEIATGHIKQSTSRQDYPYPFLDIRYPISYTGHLPHFIQQIQFVDNLWLLPKEEYYIWAYHLPNENQYELHLALSSKKELLDQRIILKNLMQLIPQPFFQVKGHIFFLSNTKQEIVVYLV